ncbi:MAG TPA: hypothetical protein ENN43_06045 [bacterium]|nr:hypothetical protein [bacterium]
MIKRAAVKSAIIILLFAVLFVVPGRAEYRAGPGRTAFNPDDASRGDKLTKIWETIIGDLGTNISSPVIYLGHIYIGTRGGILYKINKYDGSFASYHQLTGHINGAVAASDAGIYFGCNDGFMYAMDHDLTLKPGWPKKARAPVAGAPVFAALASVYYVVFSDTAGNVYFINPMDGSVTTVSSGDYTAAAPALAGNNIITTSPSGRVYKTNESEATAAYLMPGGSYVPAVAKNTEDVFVADVTGRVHLLNIMSGTAPAVSDLAGKLTNPLIYNTGRNVITAAVGSGSLFWLNGDSLAAEKTSTGSMGAEISGGAAGAINTFIIKKNGSIEAYDNEAGHTGTMETGAAVFGSMALDNCMVIYGSDGKLSLYAVSDSIDNPPGYSYLPDFPNPVEISGSAGSFSSAFKWYDIYYENPDSGRVYITSNQAVNSAA